VLGQTTVAASSDFLTKDYVVAPRKKPGDEYREQYRRYEPTEDHISPMASAGDEGFIYQATGLTHNEKGRPAFDYATQQRMHEKRWQKLAPLRDRHELVAVFGKEQARKGIVAFGSSAQVVLETVKDLRLESEVKVCIPELMHPLPHRLISFVGSLEKLLVVEMNYSGQFHRYLRSQIDLPSDTRSYARAGGLGFSGTELSGPIAQLAR